MQGQAQETETKALHFATACLTYTFGRIAMFGTSDLLVLVVSFGAACFMLSLCKSAKAAS